MPGGQDGGSIAAEAVSVRIQEAMRAPFEIAGTELYVTASQGIGVFPVDADDAVTLMKHAETAMFESKRLGPGGFVVHARKSGDAMRRSRCRPGSGRPSSRSSGCFTTSRWWS